MAALQATALPLGYATRKIEDSKVMEKKQPPTYTIPHKKHHNRRRQSPGLDRS